MREPVGRPLWAHASKPSLRTHGECQASSQAFTRLVWSYETRDDGKEVDQKVNLNARRTAVGASIAVSALVGGLGVGHAVAATNKATPSPNKTKSSTSSHHNCPNDRSGATTSGNSTNA